MPGFKTLAACAIAGWAAATAAMISEMHWSTVGPVSSYIRALAVTLTVLAAVKHLHQYTLTALARAFKDGYDLRAEHEAALGAAPAAAPRIPCTKPPRPRWRAVLRRHLSRLGDG